MSFEIRYLARLRDDLGVARESFESTGECHSLADLIAILSQRGAIWRSTLNDPSVMVAVNKSMAQRSDPIRAGDEIAFLPPVTGG